MVKIYDGLWVGTIIDIALIEYVPGFSVLGVCKEPLHRKYARMRGATIDGYLGRAMPNDEPEYLMAKRDDALYCNLVDAPDPKFISDEIIDACLKYIDEELENGREVLIVCNRAESRSPSIAFMWLMKHKMFHPSCSFEEAMHEFKSLYYPSYNPGKGFLEYTKNFWEENNHGKT